MHFSRLITAVDAHAAGEPGRVITGGVVDVPGQTMLEKKHYLEAHGDELRKLMLQEPRGYPALCCNVILPPTTPEADAGYVIMEHTEYPGMSGTNTICVATVLLETGMVPMQEPVTELILEAPAGLIKVKALCENGKVLQVTFRNVPVLFGCRRRSLLFIRKLVHQSDSQHLFDTCIGMFFPVEKQLRVEVDHYIFRQVD